jgi:mRNA interferase MazF
VSVSADRGDVWYVDLDPVRGREQGRTRPALIVSASIFNAGPAEMVIVIPITTTDRRIPTHIQIDPPEGGLTYRSFAKAEDIRSISKLRLQNRIGSVSAATLRQVEDALVILLDLGAYP